MKGGRQEQQIMCQMLFLFFCLFCFFGLQAIFYRLPKLCFSVVMVKKQWKNFVPAIGTAVYIHVMSFKAVICYFTSSTYSVMYCPLCNGYMVVLAVPLIQRAGRTIHAYNTQMLACAVLHMFQSNFPPPVPHISSNWHFKLSFWRQLLSDILMFCSHVHFILFNTTHRITEITA